MSDYKVTSFDLKLGLLEKFRFEKGCVVAEECMNNDVVIDTGEEIVEIEVKISKADLFRERKKMLDRNLKHEYYTKTRARHWLIPNRFYFCVPTFLVEDAKALCKELNSNYGVIEFNDKKFLDMRHRRGYTHGKFIKIVKRTKKLHDRYNLKYARTIALRATTKAITLMQNIYKEKS